MSHIDRLVNTLILNGVFDRCKGVILGEFTDCEANLDFDSVEQMLRSYLDGAGIPVCCGFPAGHDEVNLPLLMGARTSLSVTTEMSRIRFHVGGTPVEVHACASDSLLSSRPLMEDEPEMKVSRLERMYNFAKYYDGVHR